MAVVIKIVAPHQYRRGDGAVNCGSEGDVALSVRRDLAGPARPLDAPIIVQLYATRDLGQIVSDGQFCLEVRR
jgi:hypothetical protein